jgi:Fe-Mn family superoxide dismutase
MAAYEITRRDALGVFTLGCTVVLTACVGRRVGGSDAAHPSNPGDPNMTPPPALAGNHTMVPLPFAASSLAGISAEMISSHHDNNYGAAVKGLNQVELDLAQISKDTPGFLVHGLRERELTYRNSKTLHETYFGNLGGDGRRSGVILALQLDTGALRTYGSTEHAQTLATSVPLLAMDMYEHAYQMDYGANVARYIDAFFANVNWDEVNRRLERAQQACALLRGKGQ